MLQKPLPLQICLESFFGTKNIRFFLLLKKFFYSPLGKRICTLWIGKQRPKQALNCSDSDFGINLPAGLLWGCSLICAINTLALHCALKGHGLGCRNSSLKEVRVTLFTKHTSHGASFSHHCCVLRTIPIQSKKIMLSWEKALMPTDTFRYKEICQSQHLILCLQC